MELLPIVEQLLTTPTPAVLWELYGKLLQADSPKVAAAIDTLHQFHSYLCELQSKATARQFSELASILDIGAIGGVALQNLAGGEEARLTQRWVIGTLSESLMIMASRQYIKGWQSELSSIHCQAAWYLARALWSLSTDLQPELSGDERWSAIQRLLAPARDRQADNTVRAALLGRLFQIVLLSQMLPLLTTAG